MKMPSEYVQLAAAVVVAMLGTGGFAAIVVRRMDRELRSAETTDVITQAGARTVEMLQEQLDRAFARITYLETRVEFLEKENDRLHELALVRRRADSPPLPGGRREDDPPA